MVNDYLPRGYWDTYLVRKAAAKRPGKATTLEGLYEEVKLKTEMAGDVILSEDNETKTKKKGKENKTVERIDGYKGGRGTLLQPVEKWEKQQERMRATKKFDETDD